MLRGRGVNHHVAEDVVQETAIRVIRSDVRFDSADNLYPWASVVAWHLVVDGARRGREVLEEAPERESPADVADEVIQRLSLEVAHNSLARLTERERAALLGGGEAAPSRRDAVRANVQRHRARGRLRAMMNGMAGGLPWPFFSRRTARRLVPLAAAIGSVPAAIIGLHQFRPPEAAAPDVVRATLSAATPETAPPRSLAARHQPTSQPHGVGLLVPRRDGPADRDGGWRVVPSGSIEVPKPTGSPPGRIGARPKEGDEPLVCVDVRGLERSCVDESEVLAALPLPG